MGCIEAPGDTYFAPGARSFDSGFASAQDDSMETGGAAPSAPVCALGQLPQGGSQQGQKPHPAAASREIGRCHSRLAVPEKHFGFTLILVFSDRCGKSVLPSSATGSGSTLSSSRRRLWGGRPQGSPLQRDRKLMRRGDPRGRPAAIKSVNKYRAADPYNATNSPPCFVLPPAGEDVSAADR